MLISRASWKTFSFHMIGIAVLFFFIFCSGARASRSGLDGVIFWRYSSVSPAVSEGCLYWYLICAGWSKHGSFELDDLRMKSLTNSSPLLSREPASTRVMLSQETNRVSKMSCFRVSMAPEVGQCCPRR